MKHTVSTTINGVEYSIETGRFAKLADGAVMVRQGDSMVLVTAVASSTPSPLDFLPLTVEYREKTASAGKIPGGFFKREARPSEKEILSARLIDRPCRPMFPKTWRFETQIIATVFSSDQQHDTDVLAAVGASAALMISSIPFAGPISELRICRVNGEFIINPRFEQVEESDLEMIVAGTDDSIVMVEGSSKEISEEDFVQAMAIAHENIKTLNALQRELMAIVSKEKIAVEEKTYPQEILDFAEQEVRTTAREQVRQISSKEERQERRRALKDMLKEKSAAQFPAEQYPDINVEAIVMDQLGKIEKEEMRRMILDENKRLDGRSTADIRPIEIEVGVLPRTHGSALFTRGETQALGTATLGTKLDEQMIDGLLPTYTRRFMLHYNFPPYSTNEVKRMTGTSRREIGHGDLAERALAGLMPTEDEFPYTVRIVSDVLQSNGSSSMATVCSGSLALLDAGVPLKKPVSGIAMGLIKDGDRTAILSDILGDEDALGDMDFKVTGTVDGITACQMDMKIQGISLDLIREALEQARQGRLHILEKMNEVISAPRTELSPYAPRFTVIMIPTELIGAVIGQGGETIRGIVKDSGAQVNIEDNGKVTVAATSEESAAKAVDMIRSLTREPKVGEVYKAKVKEVREGLGAIMEFLPKKQGLLHVSQIDHRRVEFVGDVLKAGDVIDVKLIEIQPDGKFRLSRKALLEVPEGMEVREDRPRGEYRGGGGDRGGRRDDRGGRDDRPRYDDRRGGGDRGGRDDRPRRDDGGGRRDDRGGRDDRPRRDDGGGRRHHDDNDD